MNRPGFLSILLHIGLAYINLVRKIGFLLLFITVVGITGFGISYPLWLFASRNQKGYSITALLILAASVTGVLVMRSRRLPTRSVGRYISSGKRMARGLLRVTSALALLTTVYFLIYLFSQGINALGIPLLILFFFFLGLFIYDVSKPKE